MKNRYLLIALGLVLVVNALVLLGIAFNRSGEPEATLILTERELDQRWSRNAEENSGVSMSLNWNRYADQKVWFDAEKLQAVGFDVKDLAREKRDWHYTKRLLSKKGYVVLELAGAAWERWQVEKRGEIEKLAAQTPDDEEGATRLARQIARQQEQLQSNSRLFPIDAGADPAVLRQRYPDRSRYAIVLAEMKVRFSNENDDDERTVYGSIVGLLSSKLHVPLSVQSPLVDLPQRKRWSRYDSTLELRDRQPRYSVTVNWGKRFEPWIETIDLTEAGVKAAEL
jgi:hypothetical protein